MAMGLTNLSLRVGGRTTHSTHTKLFKEITDATVKASQGPKTIKNVFKRAMLAGAEAVGLKRSKLGLWLNARTASA
jgi:hypothetical protein